MIDLSLLEKFDSQGMHKVYDIWPKIAKESYFSELSQIEYEKCSNIVFAITINKAYGHKHDPLDQITENVFSILMKD